MQDLQTLLSPFGKAVTVKQNEPMAMHTTLRVGGVAQWFVELHDIQVAPMVLHALQGCALPLYILGRGSNVLVRDGVLEGIVVCTNGLSKIAVQGDYITAQAGATLHAVAQCAQQHGLAGASFLDGIPGTVGGALVMNAGAYGGEIGNLVTQTTYLYQEKLYTVNAQVQQFGYRESWFQHNPEALILQTTLQLQAGDGAQIADEMKQLAQQRRDKQPLNYPSAGSTFKRPEGYFAAKLIDDTGLRGYTIGGAQVSEKHAGFLINRGGATAQDMLQLIAEVQKKVRHQSGVELECEVRIL